MALAERTAEVHWESSLARGQGSVRGGSGAVSDVPLDWASRSDRAHETTSPEELLAAAHASCYAMALSLLLTREAMPPERLDVTAKCSLEPEGDWYRISALDIDVRGEVPGLDAEGFTRAAKDADARCPVANAVRGGVEIRLSATLEGSGIAA